MGPEVTGWLAKKRHPRWHLHFVPTSPSWLNLARIRSTYEGWPVL